jgi:hypothetical protein
MSNQTPSAEIVQDSQSPWGTDRRPMGCPSCHRVFLVKPRENEIHCPLCRKGILESQPVRLRNQEPEKLLPFKVGHQQLSSIFQDFTSPVWIKPNDFTPRNLLDRCIPVFWPLWLVDSDINGHWQMEAGFDYQVESSKEFFAYGQWQSRKQVETRVRWEPRLGELTYHVDNVTVPALEEHENRIKMTGGYHLEQAVAFDPNMTENALLEVPDLPPEDAWPMAEPKVNQAAWKVSEQASGAQHSRNYSIKAEYTHLNWTQFYLPLYATSYLDDDGQPQIVIVNGETGVIHGPRLASRKRGLKIGGIIGAVAIGMLFLMVISFLLMSLNPAFGAVAALLGFLGFGLGITAIIPAAWPASWNRKQDPLRIAQRR